MNTVTNSVYTETNRILLITVAFTEEKTLMEHRLDLVVTSIETTTRLHRSCWRPTKREKVHRSPSDDVIDQLEQDPQPLRTAQSKLKEQRNDSKKLVQRARMRSILL